MNRKVWNNKFNSASGNMIAPIIALFKREIISKAFYGDDSLDEHNGTRLTEASEKAHG